MSLAVCSGFHLECTVSTLVGNRSYEVVCFTFTHSGGYHMIAFSTDVPCCLLRFHLECTVSTLVGNRSYEVVGFTFAHSGGTPPHIFSTVNV